MSGINILVVDDIFANRFILTEILKDLHYNYLEAADGVKAIELLKQNNVDLILMDIEMPKMNGIETVHYIRNKLDEPKKSVPVIALTAHDPYTFFEDYTDVKFNSLLTKPYKINTVANAIRKLLQ